jgi:hypothetical protein
MKSNMELSFAKFSDVSNFVVNIQNKAGLSRECCVPVMVIPCQLRSTFLYDDSIDSPSLFLVLWLPVEFHWKYQQKDQRVGRGESQVGGHLSPAHYSADSNR